MSNVSEPARTIWWRDRDLLRRCLTDLIFSELVRSRRSSTALPPRPWPESLRLDDALGADSLERLTLASAVAEFIQLHHAGTEDAMLVRRTLGDWVTIAQTGLDHHSAALTFRTSGSSAEPKACEHALGSLLQEVEALAALFSGTKRILSAVPSHHIYGFLFTVLLPQALGLGEADILDVRGSSPARLAQQVLPGDLVIGHPEFWQAVARAVPTLSAGARGVTSTAPCPDSVSDAIEQTGLGALYHIYGASETAGIGWRASFRDAYRLFEYWQIESSETDQLVRTSPAGERRMFAVPDHTDWIDARHFRVGSRRDAAVQVGGINVYPAGVRDVLLRHPQVSDVVVRLMRPDEGTRLKAFIVPSPAVTDLGAFEIELRAWIGATLPAAERPQAFRFGTALPVTEAGKAADWI